MLMTISTPAAVARFTQIGSADQLNFAAGLPRRRQRRRRHGPVLDHRHDVVGQVGRGRDAGQLLEPGGVRLELGEQGPRRLRFAEQPLRGLALGRGKLPVHGGGQQFSEVRGLSWFSRRSASFLSVQQVPQFQPGPVQSAADGPDRHVQNLRDLLVLQPFDVLQHQHRPVLRRQPVQRGLELGVSPRSAPGPPRAGCTPTGRSGSVGRLRVASRRGSEPPSAFAAG